MALHWPTFFSRLGSAIVFAFIMMAGLLWNEWSFYALVTLILFLCLRDYFRLMPRILEGTVLKYITWLTHSAALVLMMAMAPLAANLMPGAIDPALAWPVFIFIPILLLLGGTISKNGSLLAGFAGVAGLLYVVLPCLLLLRIYAISWHYPLVLILCIWMNDTMAYLVGSFIGRTPFSAISPKKTWEGTTGGALLTMIGAGLAAWLIPSQSMAAYLGLALCAALAGTAGDLLESKLKRLAGVKDSGTLMPGHGGALDRFDSLLVATPFAFGWLYLLQLYFP